MSSKGETTRLSSLPECAILMICRLCNLPAVCRCQQLQEPDKLAESGRSTKQSQASQCHRLHCYRQRSAKRSAGGSLPRVYCRSDSPRGGPWARPIVPCVTVCDRRCGLALLRGLVNTLETLVDKVLTPLQTPEEQHRPGLIDPKCTRDLFEAQKGPLFSLT